MTLCLPSWLLLFQMVWQNTGHNSTSALAVAAWCSVAHTAAAAAVAKLAKLVPYRHSESLVIASALIDLGAK